MENTISQTNDLDNKNNKNGVRQIVFEDREIASLLLKRSKYAQQQLDVIKKLKKLQAEYNELEKAISQYNETIIDKVYSKYFNLFDDYEDIYEVRVEKNKIHLSIKDVIEEMKVLAKDKFLESKNKWLLKQEAKKELKETQGELKEQGEIPEETPEETPEVKEDE